MMFSETNTKIATALAKSWASLENPKKNMSVEVKTKKGGIYTFDYADLGSILDEAKPVLKENEISIIQNAYTSIEEGNKMVCVETMLLHSSGEFLKSDPLKFHATGNIQDMGGLITYMKRYSLSAILGISTDKDDDANGALGKEYQYQEGERKHQHNQNPQQNHSIEQLLSKPQKETINKQFKKMNDLGFGPHTVKDEIEKKLGHMDSMDKMTRKQADQCIKFLNEWIKKMRETG